ncbi:MAG: hypothetical protein Q9184_005702 [Pyrenodesmia sp. 2 TL-2023]
MSSYRAPEGHPNYIELFDAAREGSIGRLETAIKPQLNINALEVDNPEADRLQGLAVLHIVAANGDVDAIQFLLENGADIDLRSSSNETALNKAAFGAHPEAVRMLLDAGAQTDTQPRNDRNTVLYSVVQDKDHLSTQHIETIKLLLDRCFDVNAPIDLWGTQLITPAVILNNLELVKTLIDRGSSLPDTLLSDNDNYDMAEYLLSQGAKIVGSYTGPRGIAGGVASGIATAASAGNKELLQLLLAHADDRDRQRSGHALHFAVGAGHAGIIELLLDWGFDINARTTDYSAGETPLLAALAVRGGATLGAQLVEKLLARGANVVLQDADGDTPLHAASYCGDPDIVQLLLSRGAETAARNLRMDTPLIAHALEYSSPLRHKYHRPCPMHDLRVEAFRIVLNNTKDVNAQNQQGNTALHALAGGRLPEQREHDRLEVARLLLERGADISILNENSETASDLFARDCESREKPNIKDSRYYCYMMLQPPPLPT